MDVMLYTASREMGFQGFIVGPAIVDLGSFQMELDHLYVAPIEDMLLGLDFMRENKVRIDMLTDELQIGNDDFDLVYSEKDEISEHADIAVVKRTLIPPLSVARVRCTLK
ncbi:hypothetical protein SNE40_009749 [Patella caerulea]|uniref:Uncharacterized protein n=1 Tax=Patella caerulea TaxID=87958 RepID=A0AAN8JTZ7_PATCE